MEYPENLTIKSDSVETYNRTKKKIDTKEKNTNGSNDNSESFIASLR